MKSKYFIIISIILIMSFASFILVNARTTNSCDPGISIVNQDPSPAIPDSYVKVIFEVTGLENCNGFSAKLNPQYPFSLDLNSSEVFTIEGNPYASGYKNILTIPYTIRVDKDALDGDYSLKLDYHEGSNGYFNQYYVEKGFNLSIQDSRTSFDAVIQESTSSQVSIAIANTGKYTANSVIVRIPQQDDFVATGTDGQMVGNLDSGDYTIVGFSIASKRAAGAYQNASRGLKMINSSSSHIGELKFDIYYTDNIGERRIVNMALPLSTGAAGNFSMSGTGNFGARGTQTTSSKWYSSWLLWIIIIVAFIVVYRLYKKDNNIFKNFLKGKDSHHNSASGKIPDWLRNAKEKEKKK